MNPVPRKQAALAGRKWYYTGKPCVHGHVSKRQVSDRSCLGCKNLRDLRRYQKDTARERARSRAYQRQKLPAPTRPCPETCELCGSPPKTRSLALDHDHDTGRFRGWLCGNCNLALGKLGDNREGMLRVIAYLDGANNDSAK